ncbi:MAG TPA: universal stress protein [Rhizomicrobium sp.]|nr:universal stress protein [Rhizomicrobium sp.]
MSIAKILVPLTGSQKDRVALDTAFALARRLGAFVDAMFVHPDVREALPLTDMPISPEILQSIIDAAETAKKKAAQAARESFSMAAAQSDARIVSVPEKGDPVATTYREETGHLREVLDREAALCDLVVFPSVAGTDPASMRQSLIDVLTHQGRPVLLCAERASRTAGSSVLIGWDGGAAAAQALTASLPILEKADAVQFACVRPDGGSERPLHDAKEYLSLHGVKSSETLIEAPKLSVAEELLETAAASEYDLLVCGGYGHSRMLETVFGGTTDYLLSHATVPIFLAH